MSELDSRHLSFRCKVIVTDPEESMCGSSPSYYVLASVFHMYQLAHSIHTSDSACTSDVMRCFHGSPLVYTDGFPVGD